MSIAAETLRPIAPDVLIDTDPRVLGSIHEPGVALCLWERPAPHDPARILARFVESGAPASLDEIVGPGDLFQDSAKLPEPFCKHSGELVWPALLDDVEHLITLFRAASGCSGVRVRLTRVIDAACAVFHVDTLKLRLLCTYQGEGTQWVSNSDANRHQLGLRGRSVRKANQAIVPDFSRIHTISAWQVGVLKGRAYPGDEHSALIHRSHPQCCEKHARIRLTLDMAEGG